MISHLVKQAKMAELLDLSNSHTINTTHGAIDYTMIGEGNPAILMIHGNSFKRNIFKHILASGLSKTHRLLAIDLPGHGDSADANDPESSYTMPGYANAAVQVLDSLNIQDVIVIGWSLGGHIAIEMAPLLDSRLKGAMLIGCPPVNTGEIPTAFSLAGGDSWRTSFPARDDLTPEEMNEYAHICADPPYEDWMGLAVKRCHQRARSIMFAAFAGPNAHVMQRSIVESNDKVLWAVVNGIDEPWINLDFINGIKFKNIWRLGQISIPDTKHAPFWAEPEAFQEILNDYVQDISKKMAEEQAFRDQFVEIKEAEDVDVKETATTMEIPASVTSDGSDIIKG
jgi:pimeloyl-ACP methyl ester carboxylesterase